MATAGLSPWVVTKWRTRIGKSKRKVTRVNPPLYEGGKFEGRESEGGEMGEFITIIGSIGTIISASIGLKKLFFSEERKFKGNFFSYKTIRKEYSKDKANGCFAIQQYFERHLSTDEIEHIMNLFNSLNAFKIFPLLKYGRKKCEFKENKYISKVTRCNYILPFLGYAILVILLTCQIVHIDNKIFTEIGLRGFIIILIFDLVVIVPFLIKFLRCIGEIHYAIKLAEVTNEANEEEPKTTNFISHFKKYGRKRRGTKVLVTVFSR